MKYTIAWVLSFLALTCGAINITNYPVTNAFSAGEWFFLSSVPLKTNFNLPGNYVASTNLVATTSNGLVSQINGVTNGYPWTNLTVVSASAVTNGYPWTNLTVIHAGAVTNGYPWTNVSFIQATSYVGAYYAQLDFTNQATMHPDFAHRSEGITTNASFTFLLPINFDPTGKTEQTVVMRVDNSLGSPIEATAPVNVHVVPGSVMWITNSTKFTWNYYPPDQTNLYAVPIY